MTDKKKSIGKHELIDKLAESDKLKGISKKTLVAMLDVLMPTIIETVKHDQEVRLWALALLRKSIDYQEEGIIPTPMRWCSCQKSIFLDSAVMLGTTP